MAVTIAYTHQQGSGTAAAPANLLLFTGQAVVIEASGTTSTNYTRPFEELDYHWSADGGVPTAYTYGDSRVTPNVALGPICAFLFVTAGTHEITLTVREPDATAASEVATIQVEVSDPTNIKYLDSAAAGGGDGSFATPYNDWATAWAWLLGATATLGAELRVKRGSTFNLTTSQTAIASKTGHRRITTYGTGALPVITCNNQFINHVGTNGQHSDGIVIDGLDVTSTWTTGPVVGFTWANGAITRCRLTSKFEYAVKTTGAAASYSFADQAIIDCELIADDYGWYSYPPNGVADLVAASKRRFAVAVNISAYSNEAKEHAIRMQAYYSGHYGIVTDWRKTTSGDKSNIKLTSEIASDVAQYIYCGYSTYSSDGKITSTIALANDGSGTFANVLIDAPKIVCRVDNPAQLIILARTCDKFTMRNAKVILDDPATTTNGGHFLNLGGQSHIGTRLLHATLVDARTGVATPTDESMRPWVQGTGGTPTGGAIRNCCMVCLHKNAGDYNIETPQASTAFVVDGCWINGSDRNAGGAGTEIGRFNSTTKTFAQYESDNSGNGYTNVNGYNLDPRLDSMLDPLSDSPLIGAGRDMGAAVPVYRDFWGTVREHDAMDIGASAKIGALATGGKSRQSLLGVS